MTNLFDLTLPLLIQTCESNGFKKFRAQQIWNYLYRQFIYDFTQMVLLPVPLREFLIQNFELPLLKVITQVGDSDFNTKFLFELSDGQRIETVLLNHDYGLSICVTTQVGCNMGCVFCASGQQKKIRNLGTGEMISQILSTQTLIGKPVNSVVIMGIGEPFDNFSNVLNFIEILNNPLGLGLGARHITVSTSGLAPQIKEFALFPYQINLAISLHAATNEIRNQLMPINKAFPIPVLIQAIKDYYQITKRRVTVEYILLAGVNDQEQDALELVRLLRHMNIYVNLIPFNPVQGVSYQSTSKEQADAFLLILKNNGIDVTMRRSQGKSIAAACGQLRASHQ